MRARALQLYYSIYNMMSPAVHMKYIKKIKIEEVTLPLCPLVFLGFPLQFPQLDFRDKSFFSSWEAFLSALSQTL